MIWSFYSGLVCPKLLLSRRPRFVRVPAYFNLFHHQPSQQRQMLMGGGCIHGCQLDSIMPLSSPKNNLIVRQIPKFSFNLSFQMLVFCGGFFSSSFPHST